MHGTYETIDGRPALRFERPIAHPVDAVWRAVTEPMELAHWFPAAVTIEPRVGGAMTFAFEASADEPSSGEVTVYDPPHRFAFSWVGNELRFELEPDDGGAGCRLRFTQLFDERDAAARDAAGWHVCLDALAARLAGATPDQPPTGPTDEWRARYDEYVERGLPAGAAIPAG